MSEITMIEKNARKEKRLSYLYRILPVISIIALIGLWFYASSGSTDAFPSPVETWDRFILLLEKPIKNISLWGHIFTSLRRVFIALILAWIFGIIFGVLLGWIPKFNAVVGPLFTAFRAVPPLAWIPLITIWFGTGESPKILLVFIGALMPVVVNTHAGISNVDKLYLDVGTVFQANNRQKLFQIAIPSALDAIFAGIKTSASAGWMVVLAAEMLGARAGVGFLITRGMESGDEALVLLSMICIGIVGALLAILTQLLEGVMCPWLKRKSN